MRSRIGLLALLALASGWWGCRTREDIVTPGSRAQWPGSQTNGTVRLPNQWALDPVGRQIRLGDFPVNLAVHPSGRHAVAVHSGYGPHEQILGLKPMSQFDAAAMPMFESFGAKADPTPYQAESARVDLTEKNQKTAWGSERSARMNFAKEDAADDLELNEIVWRSVRGPSHPMPAPVRAGFVRMAELDDD